ncbi:transcriptional regulator [Enterobacter kobei]|nr:transcriptional regulator [Enterobacter kobei]
MSLPPLYALRAFEVAARLNSFSKAAETLNITPGAVSRHVRTLELWFDCELFKRQGPRVEVNEAGRILAGQLAKASRIWSGHAGHSKVKITFCALRLPAPLR